MRLVTLLTLFLISVGSTFSQVNVPDEIEFGGMRLKLTEGLQRLLKADIELITKSPKGFQIKVDRANLYFPLVEKALNEEGVPDDFKFLALQESSLVPDAISTSKAVGYWQFKKESAVEVGLRVDHEIDERMNIISSTRGAARYLKKNNITLNNWVYALLSYNTGLGGVKSLVKEKYLGATQMTIDQDIHWYVIRFLAHKLAYQDAVGKLFNPSIFLVEYRNCNNKTLKDISSETQIDMVNLEPYNKWLLKHFVPEDKPYSVILPVTTQQLAMLKERNMIQDYKQTNILVGETHVVTVEKDKRRNKEPKENPKTKSGKRRFIFSDGIDKSTIALLTEVNRIKAIKAKEGDTPDKLAIQGGIAVEDFLRYNDLKSFESIIPGKIYFLQPKRKKAVLSYYTVKQGETLKDISQEYGISIKSIRSKNRMKKGERLDAGRVLWLRRKRPKVVGVEFKKAEEVKAVGNENNLKQQPADKYNTTTKIDTITKVISHVDTLTVHTPEHTNLTASAVHEVYKVKQGETLYGISRAAGVSVDSIKAWNGLIDNNLSPGMDLLLHNPSKFVLEGKSTKEVKTSANKQNNGKVTISNGSIIHTVQQGETMYSICRTYSTEVDSILAWNGLKDYSLKQGMTLVIKKPINKVYDTEEVEHVVQHGETMYKISKLYNVSVEEIVKWNNKSTSSVSIGEKLVIKKGR